MTRTRHIVIAAATLSLLGAGCGSEAVDTGSSDPSSGATAAPVATAAPATTAAPIAATTPPSTHLVVPPSTTSTPPATLPLDLLDPAAWIGRRYVEEQMADPFQHVILDGIVTDFITVRYGTTSDPDPIGFPAFVRPDPGGYGYSGTEPGPWIVLAYRPIDPMNWPAGGVVSDALLTTSVADEVPASGCRSIDGASGVFLGFVVHDPTYVPDGTETAPFPVSTAWRISDDVRLEPVAADGIACDWYEFGD